MDALMTFFNLPLNCELYCTPPRNASRNSNFFSRLWDSVCL